MGKEKKSSTKKIPKIFRKKIKVKKWKKKILKNIQIPSDRKWIKERFELVDDKMILKSEIPREDLKKLKVLGKSIKKNKGTVTRWKGILLLALAAVIIVFNLFFKNMLIEKGIEAGLQTIFQANADAREPKLSLIKGRFSMEGLIVQNKDKPKRNLFEFGDLALDLSIPEFSRNRYHIEEIRLEDLRLNSSRDSADLPDGERGDDKKSGSLLNIPDLTDGGKEQILALIGEQRDNLKTLQYIDTANKELDEFTERWKGIFDESKGQVEDSVSDIEALGNKGIPTITSLEEAEKALKEYQGIYNDLNKQKKELEDLNKKFNEEKDRLLSLKGEIESLIQGDLDYLRDLLQLPDRGEVQNLVSDKIKEILMERFQDYYNKAMLVMPYYEKWKVSQEGKEEEKKKKTKRLAGRYIPFPSADQPRILVKAITLNGGDKSSGLFQINLTGMSSEPDKLDDPIKLVSMWNNGSTRVDLDGYFNLKSDAPQLFNVNFKSPANPAEFKEGFPALGIKSAGADLTYTGNSIPHPDKDGILVSLDMDFANLKISLPEKEDMISRLVKETVDEIRGFLVSAEIHIDNDGIQDIRIKSDVDKIIREKLGDLLKNLPAEGAEELEAYLRELVSNEILNSDKLSESLDALGLESLQQIQSLDDLKDQVKEYENEVRSQGDVYLKELEDKARAEAEKLKAEADAARKAAEDAAAAEAAKAKAEAEAAKKAAEDKAREEAEKEADKIKLPGF